MIESKCIMLLCITYHSLFKGTYIADKDDVADSLLLHRGRRPHIHGVHRTRTHWHGARTMTMTTHRGRRAHRVRYFGVKSNLVLKQSKLWENSKTNYNVPVKARLFIMIHRLMKYSTEITKFKTEFNS